LLAWLQAQTATRKLGATNRTHAIAVRDGLIGY
jgi:hypothetical protein